MTKPCPRPIVRYVRVEGPPAAVHDALKAATLPKVQVTWVNGRPKGFEKALVGSSA